jgi:hypothetical protein
MTDGGALIAGRGWRAQLNHDDEGGGDGYRCDGVEDDAERAVVGVGLERMGVGYLDDGEEGQQDEAQNRRRHEYFWSGEEGLASSWLEPAQSVLRRLRIH